MKQIEAHMHLLFTTDSVNQLGKQSHMKQDIQQVVNNAVELYLQQQKIEENEVYVVTIDELHIEDCEED